jgi:hypothetical protein
MLLRLRLTPRALARFFCLITILDIFVITPTFLAAILQPPVVYNLRSGLPSAVAIADVNRDGHGDVIVASLGSVGSDGTVSVLLSNADGTLQPPRCMTREAPIHRLSRWPMSMAIRSRTYS